MDWSKMLKPTRWKVFISLTFFVFPLAQVFAAITSASDWYYNNLSVDAIIIEADIYSVIGGTETIISQPFAPLLRSLGWWSNNGIFVAPNGPLLPGSFLVAITYSIILYTAISLSSAAWKIRRSKA